MEQRSEPRSDYFARVEVCFQPDGSDACSFGGVIEDRSKSGLAIRVRKPVPVGSEISVLHRSAILRCEIRRCVQSGTEYLLGVRLLSSNGTE